MSERVIPLARPAFDERELEAVRAVLDSRWVVQGPKVAEMEAAVAELHGARHCVAVSSGTAALHVSLLAAGIKAGDAVFVPSFAWPSAANMAAMCGARPVFVDCLPDTYNLDAADLRARIAGCEERRWGRPRFVLPVHEFGLAADMDAASAVARAFGLTVIEDAACALGASYGGRMVGTLAPMGTFSFHPRKAVTTGEGGAIVTNDDALAERCRALRNHGQAVVGGARDFVEIGPNYRMTEIQAAIGCVQLAKFPEILAARRRIARVYLEALAGCGGLSLPAAREEHTWQTFMVVLDDGLSRAEVVARLAARGVQAGPGSVAGHCGAVYRERFGYARADLPVSARLHEQGLALPLFGEMTDDDAAWCAAALREVLG